MNAADSSFLRSRLMFFLLGVGIASATWYLSETPGPRMPARDRVPAAAGDALRASSAARTSPGFLRTRAPRMPLTPDLWSSQAALGSIAYETNGFDEGTAEEPVIGARVSDLPVPEPIEAPPFMPTVGGLPMVVPVPIPIDDVSAWGMAEAPALLNQGQDVPSPGL